MQIKKGSKRIGEGTYLLSDLRIFRLIETLWSLVPVCANSLTRQFNLVLVFLNNLAKPEISDFDFSIVENNVLRLQIVVDNLLLLISQVL